MAHVKGQLPTEVSLSNGARGTAYIPSSVQTCFKFNFSFKVSQVKIQYVLKQTTEPKETDRGHLRRSFCTSGFLYLEK